MDPRGSLLRNAVERFIGTGVRNGSLRDNHTADHVDEVVCTRQGKPDMVSNEDLKRLRNVHETWWNK